jgi:CelD/BcsL family acetyltransferase involved in cellulose biosynthesis
VRRPSHFDDGPPLTTNSLDFEVVRDAEALSSLRADWERLWAASAPQFYTQSFPAVWLTWTHCHQPQGHRLHVVVGRLDGRVVLIWPMMVRRERSAKIWRLADWLGREPVDFGDILVEPAAVSSEQIRAALRHLVTTAPVDVVSFQAVRPDANVFAVLDADGQQRIVDDTAPYIDIREAGDWAAYQAALPKSFRKGMERRARRLEEAGKVEITLTHETALLEETVRWITERKAEWIDERDIIGYGISAEEMAATIGVLTEAAQAGRILIARFTVDGVLVAADVSQLFNGRLFADIGSFDLAWGKYAPGSLLMRATIEWAFDNDVAIFDFARGAYDYKLKWSTQTADLTRFFYARTLLGKLYVMLRTSSFGERLAEQRITY